MPISSKSALDDLMKLDHHLSFTPYKPGKALKTPTAALTQKIKDVYLEGLMPIPLYRSVLSKSFEHSTLEDIHQLAIKEEDDFL